MPGKCLNSCYLFGALGFSFEYSLWVSFSPLEMVSLEETRNAFEIFSVLWRDPLHVAMKPGVFVAIDIQQEGAFGEYVGQSSFLGWGSVLIQA